MYEAESFEIIQKNITREVFSWILKDCLSNDQLDFAAKTCGIPIPRGLQETKKLNLIANELSKEYFRNQKVRVLLYDQLCQATKQEKEWVLQKNQIDLIQEANNSNSKVYDRGVVGKYLWSMLNDNRPEVQKLSSLFVVKVNEKVKKFTEILKKFNKDKPSNLSQDLLNKIKPNNKRINVNSSWEKDLKKKEKEIKKYKDMIDELDDKNKVLSNNNKQLKNEIKKIIASEQDLKRIQNEQDRLINQLKDDIHRYEVKFEENAKAFHQFHQIERENKKLAYELEKIKEQTNLDQENINKSNDHKQSEKYQKDIEYLQQQLTQENKKYQSAKIEIQTLEQKIKILNDQMNKDDTKLVKKQGNRVGIFVDVQNIFYTVKSQYNGWVDYSKLLEVCLRSRILAKAYAYVVRTPENKNPAFWDKLVELGFIIRSKDIHIRADGTRKGDWDMGIAIDAIRFMDKIDIAVLVSGDGDFVDLVKMLQSNGIRVEVISVSTHSAQELIDQADQYLPIREDMVLIEK